MRHQRYYFGQWQCGSSQICALVRVASISFFFYHHYFCLFFFHISSEVGWKKWHVALRTQLTEAASLWPNSGPIVRFREAINQLQGRVWSGWLWPITGGLCVLPVHHYITQNQRPHSKSIGKLLSGWFHTWDIVHHWSTNWGLSNVHIHIQYNIICDIRCYFQKDTNILISKALNWSQLLL